VTTTASPRFSMRWSGIHIADQRFERRTLVVLVIAARES
jgi:hypothetical protein